MQNWMTVTASVLAAMLVSAEPATQPSADSSPKEAFPLWANGAPLAQGTDPVKDVPTLTPFWPTQQASGAAMVICPGGGYAKLAPYEGKDYAEFLARHGIAGFVPAMMLDVQRAIRYVRANAAAWGIDPHRIGVMGSSAGGHLASVAATHFDAGNPAAADPIDRVNCRPDVAVLIYPVISMGPNTHLGSLHNLLGEHPDPALVTFLSSELQVTPQTPPCFLFHRFEDKTVKLEGVLDFAAALRKNGVPFDLHVFEQGGHGGGLGGSVTGDESQLHPWTRDLLFWLKAQKMID
jgi:acetyl esterase/lipase